MDSFLMNLVSNRKFLFAFALVIAGIVIFHRLGEAFLGGDDCYYSQVAKEMARSGDYLSPRNAGNIDFHTSKPPLLFWMNILSGKLFGFTSFAMRLPSACLGFLGVFALLFFVNKYFDHYTAFFSALILTFTQQYLYHARSAVTDGPFAVFFSLSLFAFWAARSEKKAVYYYLMGIACACAVMTRQLPGFFIYCVIFAYVIISKEWEIAKNPHFYAAILLSLALILPWHLVMYHWYGQKFLKQYFGVTLMTAFYGYPAGYSSSTSLNPWYAYFSIIVSNYEPWLLFLAAGVYKIIRHYDRFDEATRKKMLFILLWIFVPLALFQMAKVKQYHYIMPLYIPFAIVSALVPGSFSESVRRKAIVVLSIMVLALSIAYLLVPIIPATLDSREFNDTMMLVPAAREAPGEINALEDGFSHFNNCLLFYGDKKVIKNTEKEVIEKISSGGTSYFIFLKEDFRNLLPNINARSIKVLSASNKSVLIKSSKSDKSQ